MTIFAATQQALGGKKGEYGLEHQTASTDANGEASVDLEVDAVEGDLVFAEARTSSVYAQVVDVTDGTASIEAVNVSDATAADGADVTVFAIGER